MKPIFSVLMDDQNLNYIARKTTLSFYRNQDCFRGGLYPKTLLEKNIIELTRISHFLISPARIHLSIKEGKQPQEGHDANNPKKIMDSTLSEMQVQHHRISINREETI
jgi:hypothetical protein